MVPDNTPPDVLLPAVLCPPMAVDAYGHIKLGLKALEGTAVFCAVDIVGFEFFEGLAVNGFFEERDGVGAGAVGLFKIIDEERPVDLLIVIAA